MERMVKITPLRQHPQTGYECEQAVFAQRKAAQVRARKQARPAWWWAAAVALVRRGTGFRQLFAQTPRPLRTVRLRCIR